MATPTDWRRLLALLSPQTPASLDEAAWEGVLRLADHHGVLPLLYYRRGREEGAGLPVFVRETLRHAYLRAAYANTRLYHELGTLLEATRAAGVAVILLKGACLAEVVYPDSALRRMCDVDLLVRPEALPVVCELSAELGYAPRQGAAVMVSGDAHHRHVSQLVAAQGLAVDWHWTLQHRAGDPAALDATELESLWERALPVTVAGAPAHMLAPEYLLLHLCLHLSYHHHLHSGCLRGCFDLAFVLEKYGAQMDWELVRERAETWRVWHGVVLALQLAHRWAGAPLPDHVRQWLEGVIAGETALEWVESGMYQPPAAATMASLTTLDSRLGEVASQPDAGGKLRRLTRTLFPPREVMALQYPAPASSWRIFLYYPQRLWDVCRRHGGAARRLLLRDAATRALYRREAALRTWLDEG